MDIAEVARRSGLPLTAGLAVKSYYVGSFWAGMLPTSVGGDVVRVSWLVRNGQDASAVTWSVVVERLLGVLPGQTMQLSSRVTELRRADVFTVGAETGTVNADLSNQR